MAESLRTDLDDQIYFYLEEEDEDGSIRLLETYRAVPGAPATVLEYGSWDEGGGLVMPSVHIWQRRRDMKVGPSLDKYQYLVLCT